MSVNLFAAIILLISGFSAIGISHLLREEWAKFGFKSHICHFLCFIGGFFCITFGAAQLWAFLEPGAVASPIQSAIFTAVCSITVILAMAVKTPSWFKARK